MGSAMTGGNMGHRLVLLVALSLAGIASAQGTRNPAYVGLGFSLAAEKFDLPAGVSADDSEALNLLAGYRVGPNVAFEVEAEFLSEFDLDGIGGNVDGVAATGSAKLFLGTDPDSIEPFLMLGLGFLDLDGPHAIDANESDWMFHLGAGVDFPIARQTLLELRASYRFPQGDLEDFEYWTLGANLQYRF
jgi:hypothetical protein